ncbi:MAG: hypothetical protein GEV10_13580 [Streptosporangiales bacterium]|nr:hypothetical protein [Streptosporangiales bacterium]
MIMSTRRPWVLSLFASLAAASVAVTWLAAPDTYPYGSGDNVRAGVNHLIERAPASAMLLTFAAVGILLTVIALRGGASRAALRVAGAGAGAETLFFAFVMADGSIMSSLGYVAALTAPVGVAVVVVLACRRWRPAGLVVVSLLLVLGAAGFASGALNTLGEAVATYLGSFTSDPEGYYVRIVWSWGMAAAAACWAWTAVASLLRLQSHDRAAEASASWARPASVRRWGRVVTIAAALGPVPYGLARLTWLTPWPLGGPGVDELVISMSLDAATRLRGSLFALPCALGVILTLGLISRWGEVFPRWVPVLSGRAVPVRLAVVPGTLMAAVITISAPGFLLGSIESGDPREVAYSFFGMPFPVWGPLLGAAVFAYWLRRTREPAAPVTAAGAS